ncbi:uncharacterized protein LOC126975596 [Leptidea sinapis]|uniref:uncharacterized protein LOC126975596 n=1 Tax=Leptidea sinapis TaxID=189913 RepID=UPI0021C3E89F|nr:uncharacterized protein LOC126975596 [Leptidea sinapis]
MTTITLEFLQDLLKNDYPDVTIEDFEGAPGSKRGDNYTSMVYRITLKGVQKSFEGMEPWTGSIIYKCLPESILRREAFKSDELFCNEVAFYKKIWPKLSSFQDHWNLAHPFRSIPTCYLAQNDLVILKDLKEQGFVMPDRRQGLTIEQCYVVLKNLAQFHALSLAMKSYDPEGFHELLNVQDGISEVFFLVENENYYKSYYIEAARNAISMVEQELADCAEKKKYLDKFESFCSEDTFFQTMVEMVSPKEPLAVICHGDCWTNNFLFRYVNEDIAEMFIVDFQLARYASPTLDLAYIVYLCLDKQQRAAHMSSLIEYYTDVLHRRVTEMCDGVYGIDRNTFYDMITKEFRQCSRFGLGIALDMYPIMTCDSDEAPNLYQSKESEVTQTHEEVKPVWTSNANCRRKMTDIVVELVDAELL